jgi:hypothetical protein
LEPSIQHDVVLSETDVPFTDSEIQEFLTEAKNAINQQAATNNPVKKIATSTNSRDQSGTQAQQISDTQNHHRNSQTDVGNDIRPNDPPKVTLDFPPNPASIYIKISKAEPDHYDNVQKKFFLKVTLQDNSNKIVRITQLNEAARKQFYKDQMKARQSKPNNQVAPMIKI